MKTRCLQVEFLVDAVRVDRNLDNPTGFSVIDHSHCSGKVEEPRLLTTRSFASQSSLENVWRVWL